MYRTMTIASYLTNMACFVENDHLLLCGLPSYNVGVVLVNACHST